MYLIVVDEAGVSAADHEKVGVVAGVIIDGDKQQRLLNEYLAELRQKYAPEGRKESFVFHCKTIVAGKKDVFKDRTEWPRERRLALVKDILAARSKIGFSVGVGYYRKDEAKASRNPAHMEASMRHIRAYAFCLAACDMWMRDRPGEIAMIVSEDHPTNKQRLRDVHKALVQKSSPMGELFDMRHINETVFFAEKEQMGLLQFADACAYSLKRYLNNQDFGEDLMDALCAGVDRKPRDIGPCGNFVIKSQPPIAS